MSQLCSAKNYTYIIITFELLKRLITCLVWFRLCCTCGVCVWCVCGVDICGVCVVCVCGVRVVYVWCTCGVRLVSGVPGLVETLVAA